MEEYAEYDEHRAYEVSPRQRRIRRRARIVAVVVALAMLLPIVISTVNAIRS